MRRLFLNWLKDGACTERSTEEEEEEEEGVVCL
jgi:hypothetical protein